MQFAKRLLEGSSISMPLDPGYEGGTIAAEVLDSSDSLRESCCKCGCNLTWGGLPLITCTGNCQPRRSFHSKCVPKSRRTDHDFKCLVCRPADREDFCFCCNSPATQDIILCGANSINGCQKLCPPIVLSQRPY